MKFRAEKPLRLISLKTVKTQKGKDLTFTEFGDDETYDKIEYALSKNCPQESLKIKELYNVVVDLGEFSTVEYFPILPPADDFNKTDKPGENKPVESKHADPKK